MALNVELSIQSPWVTLVVCRQWVIIDSSISGQFVHCFQKAEICLDNNKGYIT